ncbi:transposase [Pseudomonas caricapapayae]|uniref:Transposase n=1 Tax=Pseudomonas caricapapayae TaxID=46678 RepID=A0A3M6EK40_9PSED|nr:transposase [Pseudomonas caricapapayae]
MVRMARRPDYPLSTTLTGWVFAFKISVICPNMRNSFKPRPLKNLFTASGCWAGLLETGGLRQIEVESISKMLACGTSILGVKHYSCSNYSCPHVKYLCNTYRCRACPSCGKKATDQWIAVQNNRLP